MRPPPTSILVGDIPVYLADSTKSVDIAPSGINLGMIRLWAWQIVPVYPMPTSFTGHSGYAVRLNYEFDVAPDAPAPVWAEVTFAFESDVVVIDALPRSVYTPEPACLYRLNPNLNFVRHDTSYPTGPQIEASMPTLVPRIECFGVGGTEARWRHSGPDGTAIAAGSHSAWVVLLTPPDREKLAVLATGQYRVDIDPQLGLAPICRPDAFTIRLPGPASDGSPTPVGDSTEEPPGPPLGTAPSAERRRPRVFITYSRDTPDHTDAVTRLWRLLETQGVDVRIDRQGPPEQRNWMDWTTTQILRSDDVLVVASPNYLAASEDRLPGGQNLGVRSEYLRLADLLYRDRPRWTKKILPVVLPGRSIDEIPLAFLPGIVDHHIVRDFTPRGAASLFRTLGLDPS